MKWMLVIWWGVVPWWSGMMIVPQVDAWVTARTTRGSGFVVSHDRRRPLLVRLQQSPYDWNDSNPQVMMEWNGDTTRNSTMVATKSNNNNRVPLKMIVFDKDGTLGNDKATLQRWTDHMTRHLRLELEGLHQQTNDDNDVDANANVNGKTTKTPEDIWEHVLHFHRAIGWDTEAQETVPSAPLAAGTWDEQVASAAALFSHFGIPHALLKVQQWHETLSGELHGTDDPVISISNLRHVLQTCRDDHGLLVAICTSDDRTGTNAAILHWNITDLIDYSICANEVSQSKPSAEPLQLLCQLAGRGGGSLGAASSRSDCLVINPNQCIVVGDTTSDTGMAQNAGAGFCIGVLTGSGTADQLKATGAHLILPHVGHIPQLFLDHGSAILMGGLSSTGISSSQTQTQTQMTPNNKTIYV
eukprot:scaffold27562_cov38-Attheya_sp.AAC.1